MTSPGAECTTGAFEKHKLWPKDDMLEIGQGTLKKRKPNRKLGVSGPKWRTKGRTKSSGKVTGSGLFAIPERADIMA
jgi:hypothetical protein